MGQVYRMRQAMALARSLGKPWKASSAAGVLGMPKCLKVSSSNA